VTEVGFSSKYPNPNLLGVALEVSSKALGKIRVHLAAQNLLAQNLSAQNAKVYHDWSYGSATTK
jgi:hypothetical protein